LVRQNHNEPCNLLKKEFEAFKKSRPPRGGEAGNLLRQFSDIDISLYEEDAYFAGIIETYLKRKEINYPLRIDLSIRERLKKVYTLTENYKQRNIIKEFINYAGKIEKLARLLSQCSEKELVFIRE
jgi:hypothetical protein